MFDFWTFLFSSALLSGLVSASPLNGDIKERQTTLSPVINTNFPDPAIFKNTDTSYYAFATTGNGKNVQVANATSPSGPWTVIDKDPLPVVGAWSNGQNVWAPDVRIIGSTYVLYYSATYAGQTAQHCVGTASSPNILGPYTPAANPIACPLSAGGAIDPSGYWDTAVDGAHYLVYKVDGNSIGNGGSCGNTVAPIVPTPIMLQPLLNDGVTANGAAIQLLDRGTADGPLIEAPNLIEYNGVYFLFFSSNCYSGTLYDVSYAYATSVTGPYTKSSAPLMVTNSPFELTSPGGATATRDGTGLVFHANCAAGRCMFERSIKILGTTVTIS